MSEDNHAEKLKHLATNIRALLIDLPEEQRATVVDLIGFCPFCGTDELNPYTGQVEQCQCENDE